MKNNKLNVKTHTITIYFFFFLVLNYYISRNYTNIDRNAKTKIKTV